MKSTFGPKRKARIIQTDEHDDGEDAGHGKPNNLSSSSVSHETPTSKGQRKAFKNSSLRQSVVLDDADDEPSLAHTAKPANVIDNGSKNGQSGARSSLSRTGSVNKKKKGSSSRLSFGIGDIESGDTAESLDEEETTTPKKATLSRRVIESNAARKSFGGPRVSTRSVDDDEDRPTYSKDYLQELKSSTPTAPSRQSHDYMQVEQDVGLDESELEGATVVDVSDKFGATTLSHGSHIPSEAEIQEKKARRARLAHENDYISLNGEDENDRGQILLLPKSTQVESRLVREDEDMAEGFEEFVDDGKISLGKKAEREAQRKQRAAMADLIQNAEGSSNDDSDDSDAERRAAYEAAQTRAGMDGLKKPDRNATTAGQAPPKVTPLVSLNDALAKFMATVAEAEQEYAMGSKRLAKSQLEKQEILSEQEEVQRLLKEAGDRFAELRGDQATTMPDQQNVLDGQEASINVWSGSRGLESFGNTPIRPATEDT